MIVWTADIAIDGNHWEEYTFATREEAMFAARKFREHDLPIAKVVEDEDTYWAQRDIEKTREVMQRHLGGKYD